MEVSAKIGLPLLLTGFLITGTSAYWYGAQSVPSTQQTKETTIVANTEKKVKEDSTAKIGFRLVTTIRLDGTTTTTEEHGIEETVHTEIKTVEKIVEKVVEKIVVRTKDSPNNRLAVLMPPKYGSPEWKSVQVSYSRRVLGPWTAEVTVRLDGTMLVGIGFNF